MAHREPMSPVDTTWLRMDRPTNLMIITGILMLEGPVEVPRLERLLAERLLSHRRFRQRPEVSTTSVYWRDDPHFEISRHIKRTRLAGRGGKRALERFVADLASVPLDFAHPLWQAHIVEKHEGGVAVVMRIHHAIADGIALLGVMLSLADGGRQVARRSEDDDDAGWLQNLLSPVIATLNASVNVSSLTMRRVLDLARHPLRAADYLRTGAGVAGELAYLLFMPNDSETRFKGRPTGDKRVAWSEPLHLPEVKAVGHALACSINDVLLACVAGAMRGYLVDKGDAADGVELRTLVPINLRPPGSEDELGNRFGIIAVELPVGVNDPLERLATVRKRMLALKSSYEPPVTLGLFAALGYAPKLMQEQLFNLLLSRASAVMTNVPGPGEPLKIAGSILRQVLFWVPQSGEIGIGASIFSYAGKVQFGLMTDSALVPDPEKIVARFVHEFESYLYHVLLEPPVVAD